MSDCDFARKKPGGLNLRLELGGRRRRQRARVGIALEQRRRDLLTRSSVDCADRIVATSSSKAFEKCSSVSASGCCVSSGSRMWRVSAAVFAGAGIFSRSGRLRHRPIVMPATPAARFSASAPCPSRCRSTRSRRACAPAARRSGSARPAPARRSCARTGARTTCSASAAWMSFSESGITSQKVSVKSNGVCAIAQKFA